MEKFTIRPKTPKRSVTASINSSDKLSRRAEAIADQLSELLSDLDDATLPDYLSDSDLNDLGNAHDILMDLSMYLGQDGK